MGAEFTEATFRPIGTVRNEMEEPVHRDVSGVVSEIVLNESLTEALDGLNDFSHIIVIFWIHRSRRPFPTKVRPRGNPDNPLTGVFSTRSPSRPNPIGLATVRLLERNGNVLRVRGLDAIDGTPVLDIKPYLPGYDTVEDAEVPPWARH